MNSGMTGTLALAMVLACAHARANCNVEPVAAPAAGDAAVIAPLAPALEGGPALPAFSPEPLALAGSDAMSLEQVQQRRRLSDCVVDEFAGYVPKTEFDNTPYRFHMDKSKNFSAEEFEAWMKKRGIRIAKGRQGAGTAAQAPAQEPKAVVTPPC